MTTQKLNQTTMKLRLVCYRTVISESIPTVGVYRLWIVATFPIARVLLSASGVFACCGELRMFCLASLVLSVSRQFYSYPASVNVSSLLMLAFIY